MRTARMYFAAVLGMLVSSAPPAEAQQAPPAGVAQQTQGAGGPVTGRVVRLDGQDVVLDLGVPDVRDGARLEVYRTVRLRHPVTRQSVEDRFVIAHVEVRQAGHTLSLARVVGAADRPLEVGDVVQMGRVTVVPRPDEAAPGDPASVSEAHARQPLPADEAALLALFRETEGADPEQRVAHMQQFLRDFPDSVFADGITRDIEALLAAATGARQPQPLSAAEHRQLIARSVGARVFSLPLSMAHAGQPVVVGVVVEPSMGEVSAGAEGLDGISGLELFVRSHADDGQYGQEGRDGELPADAFAQVPMILDAAGHARAAVPSELVRAPGFSYFVVAVSAVNGAAIAVVGSGQQPVSVRVPTTELDDTASGPRARVRFNSEVASFDGASGDDWFVAFSGDFLYRVQRGAIHAVRVGYGHYRGRGPADIDDPSTVRAAGFSYGFLETELRFHRLFAVLPRVTVGLGLGNDGFSEVRGGFQLRVRIGPDDGTNLVLGAETIPEIGQRAFIGLSFTPRPRWPMAVEVHVTDQPVNEGELAVRGILEVGRQFTDAFALSLRASYQGRSIDHAGLGAGLALTFDW